MTSEDDGLVGQLGEQAEALYDLHHAAALEVSAPDGLAEEGVAGKQHVLVGDMEAHRTTGMARGVDDVQLVCAKANLITVFQVMSHRWIIVAGTDANELDGLVGEMLHETGVFLVYLRQ